MYKKKPSPRPSTVNPDGTLPVLVELRAVVPDPTAAAQRIRALNVPGCSLDETYDPVPMAGGTVIVRCHVGGQQQIDALKQQLDVVEVWPETPIAPMRPS